MECLVHIAYRTDFKSVRRDTPEKKALSAAKKESIQTAFRLEMGLLIDVPKSGSGTSNDGNTARRFFEEPPKTARLLQFDKPEPELLPKATEIITRFSVVLKAINSGYAINVQAFRQYCMRTAELYVAADCFGWYFMPPALHRIFLHGADIIAHAKLPVGTLSEEPQENRNKDIKNYREMRARKCSR